MAGRKSPEFGKEGVCASTWSMYDQQQSDEDDDEPRLMIDTSEDDEDSSSASQSSATRAMNMAPPLRFPTEISPDRIKALVEATPTLDKFMKDMKIPPELDKLVKDASAGLKKSMKDVPENFMKAMNDIMSSPDFQKAILEMELTPSLVRALDEMKQLQQAARDPKFPTTGCEKTTKESTHVGVNPLLQLQDFVRKPWNAIPPGGHPPNTKISSTSISNSQGCEFIPLAGVSSKYIPPVQAPPAPSIVKFNVKPRSTTKRSGSQLPRLPQNALTSNRSKLASASINLMNSINNHAQSKQPDSRIGFILNTLNNAAHDQKQMQEMQQFISEPTNAEEFQNFQSFIKHRYRDGVPEVLSPFVSMTNSSATIPLPPALTIIPTQDGCSKVRKSSCRRSPPPMVPIENFAGVRKPLNDDYVVLRLKRLGTDIELERTTTSPPQPSMTAHPLMEYTGANDMNEEDDDPLIPLSVDCILSTEPIVTIDEAPDAMPFKCFDVDASVTKKLGSRSCIPPPPPSLIPISCKTAANSSTNRYVPILPNLNKPMVTKTVIPSVISKKSKRKQKPSFKSDIAKLAHALVQPAGALKNNEVEIVNALRRTSGFSNDNCPSKLREVEIFKIDDKPPEKMVKKQDSGAENSIEKIVRRLKEKPKENIKTVSESCTAKSDKEELAEVDVKLVETPPLVTLKEVSVEAVTEDSKQSEAENESLPTTVQTEEESPSSLAEAANEKITEQAENRSQPADEDQSTAITTEETSSPVSRLFVFHSENAVITTLLASGRKLYTCKVCSGVYCKMYSAKKHYFRHHVNPRMVNEQDALKFGLETHAKNESTDEGFYRCNECGEVFVKMLDLKKHLLVHPVEANETSERGKKSSSAVSYECDNCNLSFTKKKIYYKHLAKCASVSSASPAESTGAPGEPDNLEEFVEDDKKEALGISRMCLFCDLTFTSTTARKTHVLQQHHPKRKQQACSYCKNKKFSDLKDLLKHICDAHSKRYFGCAICKIRFKTKGDLTAHNAESHASQEQNSNSSKASSSDEKTSGKPASTAVAKPGKVFKCTKCSKTFPTDKELKRHRKKGHNATASTKASSNGSSSDPYEQKYRTTSITSADYETEFYRNITQNIRFNVEFCMDGKLIDTSKPNDLKAITRSSVSQQLRAERDLENELSFENMYGAQNMNSQFISNVSRLHLATQLAVLRKTSLLDGTSETESPPNTYQAPTTMAKELALTENSEAQEPVEENGNNDVVFSGEWTRPKKYICSTCFVRFNNLWDMEDHRWMKHPNVWVSNYEFPADQAPGTNWAMKRCLASKGVLGKIHEDIMVVADPRTTCTKCQKVVTPTAEFHKHILECGGDTTWMSTMFAPSSYKKHKKWKPYGSRRRRNVGRVRGLKRNIPTTPVKIIGLSRNRQKAGDTETIQKMIANLPPKRITRRIIQFDDVESRNQNRSNNNEANILTRKRREKLDAKTSSQIAKTFATDDYVAVRMPDAKKKKQKDESATIAPGKKSTKSKAKSQIKTQDQTSDVSPAISDTDVSSVKEEEVSSGSVTTENTPKPSPATTPPPTDDNVTTVKQEEEEPELDLEKIEPAEPDSLIPDSSVILAAMRETMRQTDAVIPTQTFTAATKKRKREDVKCKKCGIKQEQPLANSICESCTEPSTKRIAPTTSTCSDCKSSFTSTGEVDNSMCEKCSSSKRGKTRSASMRDQRKSDDQSTDSSSGSGKRSSTINTRTKKTAKKTEQPNEVIQKSKELEIENSNAAQIMVKTEKNAENSVLPLRDVVEWASCKVCHRTNHGVVCKSCVLMSQKHKICARCNVRWEDPEKTGMPVCLPCEKEWYSPQQVDDEDVDKCTECDSLKLKKTCNKCSTTELTEKDIKKEKDDVTLPVSTANADVSNSTPVVTSVVAGSSTVPVMNSSITMYNNFGVATPSTPCATTTSINKDASVVPVNTVDTSIIAAANSGTPAAPVIATNTSTMTTVTAKSTVEDAQGNTSPPSKKNVILICKGCYGLYDKVSAYKQHCDTCQARVSCMEEKKPLLGFAKRNAKKGVELPSGEMNGGASFEILEGVQIKSFSVAEGGKADQDQNCDGLVPLSVYDSDSSTSSKRLELSKATKTKRSIASDESMNETIESVIKSVCYGSESTEKKDDEPVAAPPSNPASESSSRRSSEVNACPEMYNNFEKVKTELEKCIAVSKHEEPTNIEMAFVNEEGAPEAPKKKKAAAKKKTSTNGRTTRSSLSRIEQDTFRALEESLKSNAKITKKRKAEESTSSLMEEEATEPNPNPIKRRRRRKQPVERTNRTLRSRGRTEIGNYIEDVKTEENAESTLTKTRKGKNKTEDVEPSTLDEEEQASLEEESDDKAGNKKQKSQDQNDLGFAVVKANKPQVRKGVKRESLESCESSSKNELVESDRKLRRRSCESDANSSQGTLESSNDDTPTANGVLTTECPVSSPSRCNFLGSTAPSVSVESAPVDGLLCDESMPMDGYEVNGQPCFEEGNTDGANSTPWYSAINFLDHRSLGSILDSVNELLSRPELASSCDGDAVSIEGAQDKTNHAAMLGGSDNEVRSKVNNSLEREDEKPTIMDLDRQIAYSSGRKVNDDSGESNGEICDICEHSCPDINALKLHITAMHNPNMPATRSTANSKLRSSSRTNLNGMKSKQRCSHCQKVLANKAETALHLKEHLKTFTSNKSNADFLKKCIAEKLEDIFLNKALDMYMKQPQGSSNVRNNPALKILSQLNAAKKNQLGPFRSAIAQMLNLDSSQLSVDADVVVKSVSTSVPASENKSSDKTLPAVDLLTSKLDSEASEKGEGYPCPICPQTFQFTHMRNQHLIMVHAPRQSTHKHLQDSVLEREDNLVKTIVASENDNKLATPSLPDTKVIRSYLLNESVNSCVETKKDAVINASSVSAPTKTVNELRKQIGRPADTTGALSMSLCGDLQATELSPPALEPAASDDQVPNNTDRSPPKLEAPAGLTIPPPAVPPPSILRQNLTTSTTGIRSVPKNASKPCRKKMSKKEIDLPPAVVKFKAEQALLELSINKFRKIRS